ncbi:MAG: hypothetical protein RIT81_15705 [Deltaproteobacteria bacterium]
MVFAHAVLDHLDEEHRVGDLLGELLHLLKLRVLGDDVGIEPEQELLQGAHLVRGVDRVAIALRELLRLRADLLLDLRGQVANRERLREECVVAVEG